jgi:hypothetical protein
MTRPWSALKSRGVALRGAVIPSASKTDATRREWVVLWRGVIVDKEYSARVSQRWLLYIAK